MKIVQLEQGTPKWLHWRLQKITATDSAAIQGVSPYKTARDLFYEKLGFGEASDSSKEYIFNQGHKVEDMLRDYIKENLGYDFTPVCGVSEDLDFMAASLDGYIKGVGITEMKLMANKTIKKIIDKGVSEIPIHYQIQVQKQLFVAGEDKSFFSVHDGKKLGHIVEYGRDEEMIKKIIDSDSRFFEMLQRNEAPPMSDKDTLFITDEATKEKFLLLKSIKEEEDRLKEQRLKLEEEIKQVANHPKVFCEGVAVTTYERQGSVDYKKIPEIKLLGDEYIESFRRPSAEVKRITIKKDKKEE
jgi:putative phage-type endonuclease